MTTTLTTSVNFPQLDSRLGELKDSFHKAQPFKHVVIDNFLEEKVAWKIVENFPGRQDVKWLHYQHVNAHMLDSEEKSAFHPIIQETIDELQSQPFLKFLGELSDIDNLIADPTLNSSGLMVTPRGGHLNIHADFNANPRFSNWHRELNVLIYFNPSWQDSYGGHLELWDKEVQRPVKKIAPIFNRCIIFKTTPFSFHGFPDPIRCPETMDRKCMGLYYYTNEPSSFRVRATDYRARPSDHALERLKIYVDKKALQFYDFCKRRFGVTDEFASRFMRKISKKRTL